MSAKKEIHIDLVRGTLSDYMIKDKSNIIIGRFTIMDLDKENKKCNVKFKFYRDNDYELLIETLKTILRAIFKDANIYKANFIINEKANLKAFLDYGFTLEGILSENLFINGVFLAELSFGINRSEYTQPIRNSFVNIVGTNLEIRNFTPDDAEELLQYYIRNKEHLRLYEPARDNSFYTYEVQKDILLESYKQLLNGSSFDFGIYKNNKLIGKAKISNIVYGVFKSGILGYSIDKKEQGKGHMTEAVNLLLKYSKEELELHRIEASALVDNNKSKNVLLKCSFKEIGINEQYLFINGSWKDHITFYKIL
ncbi:GNAT family N-acetyltransferase [Clostridium gasigenes]|uniref:Ribosomal-protein-alanine N-acetyltransferase n=1 Tax=Clostridium gasigenes TaxID=94869 RepID=A0A1H0VQ00_9CLOT|nr:GNAT family protein [Clostridium gasigenes]MBB6624885.1 GNAT family N-acetyltransferase [Clostridium gasigenes]MBU3089558.1 GNAT family N-acetyltransferase [Clostridium gasigenes]SDP80597.1 ribosomal-protein-alanine N-acetyltransferase [Clostridium gasigenes]